MHALKLPHSASVELWLHCGGQRFELGQVGGKILILAKAEPIPGGEAFVEIIIDGDAQRHSIGLIPAHSGETKRLSLGPTDQ